MKMVTKYIILFISIAIMGICGIYLYFIQKNHDVHSAFNEKELQEEWKNTITQASENVGAKLHSTQELITASRDMLGKARGVLAEMGELNNKISGALSANGIIQGKVEKGDTIAGILEEAGVSSPQNYVNAAAKVFPLRTFRAGQPYAIITDPFTGQIRRFEYEVNDRKRLVIEGVEHPQAKLEDIEYITLLDKAKGIIEDNLFQAVADIGESPQLATRLVNLFSSEINFIRDLQEGDKFSVLIEKRYREGEAKGYGRILAASFTNKGRTYEAYLFRDGDGQLHHYNGKGENLKKTLLMNPLAVTRLTSKFSYNRKHPILGGERPHLGVDYAAPTGTPVKAVGNGVVTKRGWGGGYGNQIILKHGSNLESMYAHLSGFARGLNVGQKVRQGQIIGFVGNTGLSTAPHLDFRLRQDGKFINPVKAINPRGAPVDNAYLASFKRVKELEKAYLDGKKLPENYTIDSIVPEKLQPVSNKVNSSASKKTSRVKSAAKKKAKQNIIKSEKHLTKRVEKNKGAKKRHSG